MKTPEADYPFKKLVKFLGYINWFNLSLLIIFGLIVYGLYRLGEYGWNEDVIKFYDDIIKFLDRLGIR